MGKIRKQNYVYIISVLTEILVWKKDLKRNQWIVIHWVSYPLLCSKVSQNLAAWNNMELLAYISESEIRAQLRWYLCFRVSWGYNHIIDQAWGLLRRLDWGRIRLQAHLQGRCRDSCPRGVMDWRFSKSCSQKPPAVPRCVGLANMTAYFIEAHKRVRLLARQRSRSFVTLSRKWHPRCYYILQEARYSRGGNSQN